MIRQWGSALPSLPCPRFCGLGDEGMQNSKRRGAEKISTIVFRATTVTNGWPQLIQCADKTWGESDNAKELSETCMKDTRGRRTRRGADRAAAGWWGGGRKEEGGWRSRGRRRGELEGDDYFRPSSLFWARGYTGPCFLPLLQPFSPPMTHRPHPSYSSNSHLPSSMPSSPSASSPHGPEVRHAEDHREADRHQGCRELVQEQCCERAALLQWILGEILGLRGRRRRRIRRREEEEEKYKEERGGREI